MWILPNNFQLASRFATASADLTKDLSELSESFATCALWRSKPYSPRTWSRRWKRVKWIHVLFGRTLRRSQHTSFETALTGYLEVIPVHRSHLLESEKARKTLDTFGRILNESSKQCDLFAASSRTSTITLHSDFPKFMSLYLDWVISLRLEYSRRKKWAHHTRGNGYSYWQNWPTATVMMPDQQKEQFQRRADRLKTKHNGKNGAKRSGNGAGPTLAMVVNWNTPRTRETGESPDAYLSRMRKSTNPKNFNKQKPATLSSQVNWGTPTNRDYKGQTGFYDRVDLPTQVGHQDRESLNGHGSPRASYPERLNPAWVCELMGTTLEKTFFVHLETPLSRKSPRKQ